MKERVDADQRRKENEYERGERKLEREERKWMVMLSGATVAHKTSPIYMVESYFLLLALHIVIFNGSFIFLVFCIINYLYE